jgi:hypothetical protein
MGLAVSKLGWLISTATLGAVALLVSVVVFLFLGNEGYAATKDGNEREAVTVGVV